MAFNLQSFLQSAKKKAGQAASVVRSTSPISFLQQLVNPKPYIPPPPPVKIQPRQVIPPSQVRPSQQLPLTLDRPFGLLSAAPGQYVGAGSAQLAGRQTQPTISPTAGFTQGATTVNPYTGPVEQILRQQEQQRIYQQLTGQPAPSPTPSPIPAPSGAPSGVPAPTGEEAPTAPLIDPEQAKEEFIKSIIESVTGQYGQFLDRTGLDPFAFDEALAKNAELQRFAPYYTQTIQQFLRGVQAQAGATGRGTSNLLQELGFGTEQFTGRSRRLLELAQEQARTGFAEKGLLFSGERGRAEGELAAERERQLQGFLRGQAFKETGVLEKRRNILEELSLEKEQRERELQQKQSEDVSAGVEAARQRAFSGARELEAVGPAPGENYQDFLGRRAKTYRSFIYGPSV